MFGLTLSCFFLFTNFLKLPHSCRFLRYFINYIYVRGAFNLCMNVVWTVYASLKSYVDMPYSWGAYLLLWLSLCIVPRLGFQKPTKIWRLLFGANELTDCKTPRSLSVWTHHVLNNNGISDVGNRRKASQGSNRERDYWSPSGTTH